MGSIISGIAIICVGLLIGDSIFQGHFTITGIIFDGLGLFWIGKGAWGMYQSRSQS